MSLNYYEVLFRIDPPYVFGIPTHDMDVAPYSEMPTIHWSADLTKVWFTRPDGTPTERKPEEAFVARISASGATLEFFDNNCRVSIDAKTPDEAVVTAKSLLDQILLSYVATTRGVGTLVTTQVLGLFQNGKPLRRNETPIRPFHVYENQILSESLVMNAEGYNSIPLNKKIEKALRYFGIGEALRGLFTGDSAREYSQDVSPLRFLQYWKAYTVILGDPSRDSKDHQSRPKLIGLGRAFFRQRVIPLNKIRDSLDVAHSIDLRHGQRVSEQQVEDCREVASEVIRAYFQYLGALPVHSEDGY